MAETRIVKINYIDSDDIIEYQVTEQAFEAMKTYLNEKSMRDGQYNRTLGYRIFSDRAKFDRFVDWIMAQQMVNGQEPATQKQINYLHLLGVDIDSYRPISKRRASELIDVAKSGNLGSYNLFYIDGSN